VSDVSLQSYDAMTHSKYETESHVLCSFVPRSKHTPSQLYKPVS